MASGSCVGKRGLTALGKRKRKSETNQKQVVDKMDTLPLQVANGDITQPERKHKKTVLGTGKHAPPKISSQVVEKVKAVEGQIMALKRMVTELQVKKGLQPTITPQWHSAMNLQSTKNMQSTQNVQPTKNPQSKKNPHSTKSVQSIQNLQSTQNVQPTKNRQSKKNPHSTKSVQSIQNLQSTQNVQPTKNRQSKKNPHSTKSVQSTHNMQSTQNVQPTKNRQSEKNLRSTKSVQSTQNLQSTKSLQLNQNLQLAQCVESTQNRQAIEPWDAIGDIARSYLDFIELNNNNNNSVTLQTQFPEGWSECELASPKPGNQIVATGRVFNTIGSQPVMLHNKPLEPGYMKVTIINPKVKNAPLPMPIDEASTVLEAVGAFVAWPTSLISLSTKELQLPSCDNDDLLGEQNESIVSETLIALKFQTTPLNPVIQSAPEINDGVSFIKGKVVKGKRTQVKRKAMKAAPTIQPKPSQTNLLTVNQQEKLNTQITAIQSNQVNVNQLQKLTTLTMKLMHRCVRGMTSEDKVFIDMPETVWQDNHNILITKDELLQWLFQQSVRASHVSIYIKYLYNLCQEQGMSKMFVFLRPQMLSSDANDADDEEVQYIATVMKGANANQIYFAPYNDGRHWMLCVIHPVKDQMYWLDPAGNEVHPYIKKVVQMAIRKFYFQKRRKKPRGKSQWFKIKCPLQTNEDDSGYYILRYMQEVIEKRQDIIPEQYYEDSPAPSCYEQKHIDEVRDKWIEFVQNHMD